MHPRPAHALVAVLFTVAFASPSHATLNACAVGKQKCVSQEVAAIFKCHMKARTPPKGLTPAELATCIQQAKVTFDGGANANKACFAKLEAKFPGRCLTTRDGAALETAVDAFVDSAVCELDPSSVDVQTDPNNCGTCGVTCPAGLPCANGQCTCPTTGDLLCGGSCIDPATDVNNCGACGHTCSTSDVCSQGHCRLG